MSKSLHRTPAQVFGDRVRQARTRRGWSVRQLAERLSTQLGRNVDVSRLENGKTLAALDTVFAVSAALAVSPLDLLTPMEDEGEPDALRPDNTLRVRIGRDQVAAPAELRLWLRGERLPAGWPTTDDDRSAFVREMPTAELADLFKAAGAAAGREVDDDEANDLVWALRTRQSPWPEERIAELWTALSQGAHAYLQKENESG